MHADGWVRAAPRSTLPSRSGNSVRRFAAGLILHGFPEHRVEGLPSEFEPKVLDSNSEPNYAKTIPYLLLTWRSITLPIKLIIENRRGSERLPH